MISLLVPTRGRPANMTRLVESAFTLAEGSSQVEVVFYVDEDDVPSIETAYALRDDIGRTAAVIGPRRCLAECWNSCLQLAEGDILGHFGDDVVFRTQGWDLQVEDAFELWPDRICFVYGRDGVHDQRLGTHGFVSRAWVDAIGYITPPYFAHDYCDTWLNEVAESIGRRVFLPDLLTEHLHPDVGKAERDQTYLDHAEAGKRDRVGELYHTLLPERLADAAKLRAVML